MIHAIDGVPRATGSKIFTFLASHTSRWLEVSLRDLESSELLPVEALSSWQSFDPADLAAGDVAIVDSEFGGGDLGLTLAQTILRESAAAVIVLCREFDVCDAIASSPRCALLHPPVHGGQLRLTLRQLRMRQPPASAPIGATGTIAESDRVRNHLVVVPPRIDLKRLRPREQQIIGMLLQHFRVPAIAATLGITPSTVRNHLKNVYRRYGVRSQQDLLRSVKA